MWVRYPVCVSCNNGPGGGYEVLLSLMYSAHGQEHSWGRRRAGIRKGPWVLPSRDGEILGWKRSLGWTSLSPAQSLSLSLSLSSFFTGLSILWVTQAFSEAFILLIYCFNIVGLKVLTSKNSSQVPLFSDWSHLQFASNCPGFSDCKMKIWEFHSQFFKSSRHSTNPPLLWLFFEISVSSDHLVYFRNSYNVLEVQNLLSFLHVPLFVLASFWPPNCTINFTSTDTLLKGWVMLLHAYFHTVVLICFPV